MEYQVTTDALNGKVILVTGAGEGIGRQTALSYAQHGATVILLGRTVYKLKHVYDEIEATGGRKPTIIPLDLLRATRQHYLAMVNIIERQFNHIDGVLHNASLLGVLCPFDQIEEKSYDEIMEVNVKAPFMMTQALLPILHKSNDGRIVFTSSSVGHTGRAFWGTYAISKFATEGMMQVLADELRNTKVKVNAINPGGTRTKMRASAFPAENINNLRTPADIMPLYLYLMAPEGIAVNGQCIDAQQR
ncbi:YciK family oxidoreductase [Candidatus Enterovibrio escicola]|uniref:Oxidoreductase n=1 Tax=Candidatus Enterovibrio escicola TaxID=1927127 RepID=A0A2A5T425_9GAMM|nr:YciK family oxidoreductase [Candidatus Enterovibrio escacola]PCS22906.1 hypothetical protein BTN49_1464 [Candidatus Enterovibrio escacola]